MRYSFISAAILAFASSVVVAQTNGFDAITAPTQDESIAAGSSFDITWEPGNVTGTITITLLQGATASTLQAGPVVAASIENTLAKFSWAVPSPSFATYGFQITLDSNHTEFQYSFPFHITGGPSSSASGATGTASTTTLHLSTGPNYVTSTSTSSVPSSTVTVISTSCNSTRSSSTLPRTNSSSNATLSIVSATSTQTLPTSSGSSSTTSAPALASSNAAVANFAQGGLALVGGLVMALAL